MFGGGYKFGAPTGQSVFGSGYKFTVSGTGSADISPVKQDLLPTETHLYKEHTMNVEVNGNGELE